MEKGVALLSGGIDSPVAIHMMQNRLDVIAAHFHQEPLADKKEVEKEFNADIQQQERKAFELALFLFVNQFEKESLKRYVEELKGLKYDNESKGEGHRLRLLDIFEKMLNLRDSKR